ncbi:MAG: hypothetical protein COV97_03880 [Zetaproteobacteria bacterium CG11_big_fil_rev_8_21_14_0_20_59_439]|nr:MAG: hypothetical protein COV97_03880 [Zetaproteobacteria bacterium CG11_big_fil_rev_8_21_14_0_20_59_439]
MHAVFGLIIAGYTNLLATKPRIRVRGESMLDHIVIGRQPIFNRDFRVVAYEILYRNVDASLHENKTAQVAVNALIDIGVHRIGGALPLYLNVEEDMLLHGGDLLRAFSPQQVYIEILETVRPDAAVLEACRQLKAEGYRLLLDDVLSVQQAQPFIDLVDIIKVDWLDADDPAGIVRSLRREGLQFLAEKIEDYDMAQAAEDAGFDLYQGYFFCRPDLVRGVRPEGYRLSLLRAMQHAMSAESVNEIFAVIREDVSLSYRLLKYINSAAFSLRCEVRSIEQALSLLGLNHIRRWLMLLTMSALGNHKPRELFRQALFRSRFLESMAQCLGEDEISDDFMLGLLSILDALLDCTMQQSLDEIRIAPEVHDGLLDPQSPMGRKLAVCLAIERGDWDVIHSFKQNGTRLDGRELNLICTGAIEWADEHMAALEAF